MRIKYIGKDRRMLNGRWISAGETREVAERQAVSLRGDPEFVIVGAQLLAVSDERVAEGGEQKAEEQQAEGGMQKAHERVVVVEMKVKRVKKAKKS